MTELAELSIEEREQAFVCWNPTLRLVVSCDVAEGSGVGVRTLQRWVAQYRKAGLVGLARKLRRDRGERRAVSPKYWMVRDIVRKLPRDLLILAHRGAKAYGESFDLVIDGKLRRQRHLAGRPCSTRHSASEEGWLRWYTLANDHHR
jgi:putative transposase